MTDVHLLSFAYTATVRSAGRKFRDMALRGEAPVRVPEIEPGREVLRVVSPRRFDLTWRESGGALWRPILARDGTPIETVGELGNTRRTLNTGDWHDYPFRLPDGDIVSGMDPFRFPMIESLGKIRVENNGYEGALARMSSTGLATIEGRPYVRCEPPAWSLGNVGRAWNTIEHLSVAVPGHGSYRRAAVCVPIDRLDDVLAIRDRVRILVEDIQETQRDGIYAPVEVTVEKADGYETPSETGGNLVRAWASLAAFGRKMPLETVGFDFMDAYAAAGRAAAALSAEPGQENEDACASAYADLLALPVTGKLVREGLDGEGMDDAYVAISAVLVEHSFARGLETDDVAALVGMAP